MTQDHQNTLTLVPEKDTQPVFVKMANSHDEENQNDKVIPESNPNLKNKKYRRIPDYCYYCENEVLSFARHIQRKHSLEPEVQRILALSPNSAERKQLISLLRKKGNFLKNPEFLFKPVRRSSLGATENNYMPCQFCLGIYSRKLLWRHKKKCPKNKNPDVCTSLGVGQNLLLPKLNTLSELTVKVFPRMLADKVSFTAKKDSLIRAFGSRFLRQHREQRHVVHVCSRKMRELAKVLIESQKANSKITNLFHLLHPQYFAALVKSVKTIAKYDAQKDIYFSPSFTMNINRSLKECCDIALLRIAKRKDNVENLNAIQAEANINSFRLLLEDNWKYEISSHSEKDLKLKSDDDKSNVQTPVGSNICNIVVMENDKNKTSENKKTLKRHLIPWKSEQKKVVIEFFKDHIKSKKPPKKDECCSLIKNHPDLLKNKSWQKIKVFVQNIYTKKLKFND